MTDPRTPPEIWDRLNTENPDVPVPGELEDSDHGLPGDAEPLPEDDAENDEDVS